MNLSQYFQITPFSSFRMVNENLNVDPRYNTLPIDDAVDESGYAQPWQTNDLNTTLQVLTPYEDDLLTLHEYDTDDLVQVVPLVPINPPILNQPFVCMNGTVDFSEVRPGKYYLAYTYTDENGNVQDIRSSPLDVQVNQPGTQVFEYTNPYNDKGVVFVNGDGTLQTFAHRVKSILYDPLAKTANQDYQDQYYELTVENSIPYENWTNFIGDANGLPWWVVKKLNLVYSLKKVKIDGQLFASTGDEFKPTRPTNQKIQNGFWAINVQPVETYNFTQYQTGLLPTGTFKVITLSDDYVGNTDNIVKANLYKNAFKLIGVSINNRGGDAFVISIGSQPPVAGVGSNDIATLRVEATDPDDTQADPSGKFYLINHYFTAARTLYVTGLTGTLTDLHFEYVDYNAPNYTPPDNTTKFVQSVLYSYVPVSDSIFSNDFTIATGLGNAGTDFENCVLAGIMGTTDFTKKLPMGWDRNSEGTLATRTGTPNNLLTQVMSQMPRHTHTDNRVPAGAQGTAAGQTAINQGNGGAPAPIGFIGLTGGNAGQPAGNADPMDITNDSIYVAYFYYLKP